MLLLGRIAAGNKAFMNSSEFEQFQVIDGFVHYPQGIPYYQDNRPERLDAVLTSIQGNSR